MLTMFKSKSSFPIRDILGVFLVATIPLVNYLKHAEYSLVSPEILIIYGLILIQAFIFAYLMIPGGAPLRVFIYGALAVLVVDVQTDWITTIGLRLLLNILFFGGLFWILRRRLTSFIIVVAGAVLLSTLVLPGGDGVVRTGEPGPRPDDDPDLPFILHLILDEHIGVEGIPAEFDPEGRYSTSLREFYLDQDFAVYGRAYSKYLATQESVPNLLNFSSSGDPGYFFDGGFHPNVLLENNAWFDLLHDRGYRIHVMENNFMRFFNPGDQGFNPHGDTRLHYYWRSLKPVEMLDVHPAKKIPFLLGGFFKRSYFLSRVQGTYSNIQSSQMASGFLPSLEVKVEFPGQKAALDALGILEEQLQGAGPGQVFFAHIMLPHTPYGLSPDCGFELRPDKWLSNYDRKLIPRFNTPESRALRYPLYLDQLSCLQSRLERMFQILRDKGLWDDCMIILHGDHGARICQWVPDAYADEKVLPTDYLDCFSTLFAVKSPHVAPGYFRNMLPLDHLFTRLMRDERLPDDPVLEASPWVYFQHKDIVLEKHPMPHFANGKIVSGSP